MKVSSLSGSVRSNVGKKDARALRLEELVPCVIYGQGTQTHFSVKRNDLDKIVYTPEVYQIDITIDGKTTRAIIKDMQQHPVTGLLQHVDFFELDANKVIKIALPVRVTGKSRGVMAGGKLAQVYRRLTVIGLPADMPEAITIDITKLRIGQSVRVKDIETEDLKFAEPSNAVVVSVRMARGAAKGSDAGDDDDEE